MSAAAIHPAFLADLRQALKSEIGARSIYAELAPRMRDRELGQLLERFCEDEDELLGGVRALLLDLGATKTTGRIRRREWIGWILAVVARGRSSSMALRLCHAAESSAARWYREHALYLARAGDIERARACEGFAQIKLRHARILEAWVER